jgi:hypothetical protein
MNAQNLQQLENELIYLISIMFISYHKFYY